MSAIYKPGFRMAKAGVMLLDLQDHSVQQQELDLEYELGRNRGALKGALVESICAMAAAR